MKHINWCKDEWLLYEGLVEVKYGIIRKATVQNTMNQRKVKKFRYLTYYIADKGDFLLLVNIMCVIMALDSTTVCQYD